MRDEDISNWIENFDPDGHPPDIYSTFSRDHGNDLIEIIEKFCQELNARLDVFSRRGPSTLDIFEDNHNLKAKYIGQETHTFLRQFLIEPIVESLDYSFLIEARSAETENIWTGEVYPDLRLIPQNWPKNEAVPTIIVEHKNFGRYKQASKELRQDYLEKTTKPVFGVATDILRWGTFRVSEDGNIEHLERASIGKILRQIRQSVNHDDFEFNRESIEIAKLLRLFESIPGTINQD